ncbi:MAG TPA: hypothetical protein VFZ65_20235 [Planctomycetota bacterium]|nr:hypothetical protein [Planctomycetota bacterium]
MTDRTGAPIVVGGVVLQLIPDMAATAEATSLYSTLSSTHGWAGFRSNVALPGMTGPSTEVSSVLITYSWPTPVQETGAVWFSDDLDDLDPVHNTVIDSIELLGGQAPQLLLLPDNHHLTESTTQTGVTGSTTWWRGTGGRFQLLYEASHFTGGPAVAGPIQITKLMFRGEDGEPNLGGHGWAGVQVQLGSTSLNTTTMSTTFATNQAPALPETTTMGSLGTTGVTELPSTGSTPNNYNIVIDLVAIGAAFTFDPTSAQPNLLIDITMPNAAIMPVGYGTVMAMQDTTGGTAVVRGRGVSSATPGAATGTNSTAPLVVGIAFDGAGGYPVLVPATNEQYGAACGGSPSTFYQAFLNGQAFDIAGLTLTPNTYPAPSTYTVTGGAAPFDATKVNATPDSIADDATVPHALGFTFAYPGGATTGISACTNGYVWLNATSTIADFSPTVAELLGSSTSLGARLMPCWYDLNCGRNTATHPNSGLHVLTDTSGGPGNSVCYVTWFDVGVFNSVSGTGVGGHAVHDLQCVMYEATGVVEFRYANMPQFCSNTTTLNPSIPAFVGFTRGNIGGTPSVDPQSRDLSVEVPFSTSVEGTTGNISQTAVATPTGGGVAYGGRAFPGQVLRWNASNLPVGTTIGVQLLDAGATRPGLQLPTITAPGCMLSTTTGALLWEVFFLPGASVTGTVPFSVPAGFSGFQLHAQFITLDLFGGPNLIPAASNAIQHTVGLQ